jgi:hypothetical protein
MAGKLVQVEKNIVTSAVGSVTLTGIDSDDVYMVAISNGIFYCNNFNNASEFSFATFEMSYRNASGALKGDTGGFVHTVAEANDGVNFFMQSGNIASGTFTLYKVV